MTKAYSPAGALMEMYVTGPKFRHVIHMHSAAVQPTSDAYVSDPLTGDLDTPNQHVQGLQTALQSLYHSDTTIGECNWFLPETATRSKTFIKAGPSDVQGTSSFSTTTPNASELTITLKGDTNGLAKFILLDTIEGYTAPFKSKNPALLGGFMVDLVNELVKSVWRTFQDRPIARFYGISLCYNRREVAHYRQ